MLMLNVKNDYGMLTSNAELVFRYTILEIEINEFFWENIIIDLLVNRMIFYLNPFLVLK